MKQAAAMLIIKDGLILAVARKSDKTKFGLPGGKCSEGELPFPAAIRETLEETGIKINYGIFVYQRVEPAGKPDGEDFYAYCFYATEWEGEPQNLEGTEVRWLTPNELTSKEMGAFPDYNAKMLEAFRKLFPRVKLKDEESVDQ